MLATKKRGDHGYRKTLGELLKHVSEQDLRLPVEQNQQGRLSLSRKEEKQRQQQKQRQQNSLVKVNKVSITPTSIRLEHPKNETANRVLRHFKNDLNRFLRVQFIDENESRIHNSFRPQHNHNLLYRRIERVLRYGIDIHGRHYTFLAFSSSQLREHGCWFFSDTEKLTTDDIRTWMGDFSRDNVVAKYAARMGQCFSSTQEVANISCKEIMKIPDIKRNGYTFSDGVGLISQKMAKDVIAASYRGYIRPLASAFQVRLGGAKGGLLGKNKKLALRDSQIKFESKHKKLEIIRSASPSPTYLNRQVVLLLSSLGVGDEIFLTLLSNMKEQLDKVLTDPIHCAATLRANGDEFGIYGNMARLVDRGFLEAKDPFITNLVQMFRVSKLREAKKKAKIHVPNAITVMGVLDETNTLKENQIFCQLSARKKKNRVIKGPCVLYRSPSLHPGDIRMVEAVDCPDLHDLYDVVVFPQQGSRDLPSMCSGGDLDGDIYSIIWDSRLFPAIRDTKPMNHQPIESPKVEGSVSINDIKRFFVDYIINDNLGQIANAHMAIADNSSQDAFDLTCISLAKLHSEAVDFPKTGAVAILENRHRPTRYPDFMEKTDKLTYTSKKILGQLYRAIEATEFEKYRDQLQFDIKYDPRMFVEGMVKYIWSAREQKKQYDQNLRELMNQYGIATESELLSGSIVNWLKREDGPDKFHETRYEVRREVTRLRDEWRRVHFPGLPSGKNHRRKSFKVTQEDKCKAAAFYYVTYHHSEQYKYKKKRKPMLSFPWLAQEILCRLARENHSFNERIDTIPELDIMSFGRNSGGNKRKSTSTATATIPDDTTTEDIANSSTASSMTDE
ncbi:RNA dependent RNA polymerase-domain-containing protein [Circinella umbellata]|nr:RNA dependent RNA polymerase-domain-containing protein [Circinella umbellata]